MTRTQALTNIRIAGYHQDSKAYVRLLVENRVSREAADKAWNVGAKQKIGGMKCSCSDCAQAAA